MIASLLAAHLAVLAGVRVEPGNRQPRRRRCRSRVRSARCGHRAPSATMASVVSVSIACAQAQMHGHRHHPQRSAGQHHHRRASSPASAARIFGMAGKAEAGVVERLLVDRVGDDGRRLAAAAPARPPSRSRPITAAPLRRSGWPGTAAQASGRSSTGRACAKRRQRVGAVVDRPDRHRRGRERAARRRNRVGIVDDQERRHGWRGRARPSA